MSNLFRDNLYNEFPDPNKKIEELGDQVEGYDGKIDVLQKRVKRVSVLEYGALGDWNGSAGTDDTTKIKDAINACVALKVNGAIPELYFPFCGGYKITSTISVPNGISVRMDAPMVYVGTTNETALVIGEGGTTASANTSLYLQVIRNTLSDWSSEACVGIQLVNVIESEIFIKQAKKFTIGVQFVGEYGKGNVYNDVTLMSINGNKVGVDLLARYGGWTNENTFYNGRFSVSTGQNNGKTRYGIRLRNIDTTNPAFVASSAYNVNDLVLANAKVYKVTVAGTSSATAPSHTSGTAVNGTVTFQFMYNANSLNNNVFIKPSLELQIANSTPGEAIPIIIENGYQNTFRSCRSDSNGNTIARVLNDATENKIEFGYSLQVDKVDDQSIYPATKLDITRRLLVDDPGSAIATFHNIQKRACLYDGSTTTHVAGLFLGTSGNANVSKALDKITINDDYLELGAARSIGVFVDTRTVKRFLIRRELLAGNEGRLAIRCYDSAGAVITNSNYVKSMSFTSFFYDANYGGVYKTGTDHSDDLYVNIHPDVAKIAILFVNGTNVVRLRGFSIHSLDGHHASVSSGYDEIVPNVNLGTAAPTVGTWPKNKVVLNDNKTEQGTTGSKYVIEGWECIVAGTPGTWIQKRNLTGN